MPCRKAAHPLEAESCDPALRYPTICLRGCCARAADRKVTAPSTTMKSRRLIGPLHSIRYAPYVHTTSHRGGGEGHRRLSGCPTENGAGSSDPEECTHSR